MDAPSPSGHLAGTGDGAAEGVEKKRRRKTKDDGDAGDAGEAGDAGDAGREKKKMKKAKKKKRKEKKKKKKKNMKEKKKTTVQMFLDFGQRAFSKRRCTKCQMLYAPGKSEDEAAHTRFCRKAMRPVQMHVRSGDDAVWSGAHGTSRHATILKFRCGVGGEGVGGARMGEIFARVQSALDASFDGGSSGNSSGGGGGGGGGSSGSSRGGNVLVFVYVIGRDAVGYLSAALLPATQDKNSTRLEVLRIWVEKQFRREKIATRLLDSARLHSLYGAHIKGRQCAMPDRTEDGTRFWASYRVTK
jgi:hypothetical protein